MIALLFPLVFTLLSYGSIFLFFYFAFDTETVKKSWDVALQETNLAAGYFVPGVLAFALIWVVCSYFTGDKILLHNAEAYGIDKKDNPALYMLVENLCITRGLPVPNIYIMKDYALNAFATGRNPKNASIAVTSGLLEKLNKQELEAVLAHELAHIENRDITLMLITIAGISFFTIIGELVFRIALHVNRRNRNRKGNQAVMFLCLIGVLFFIFGYLIAPLIRLAMSREREYLADATSALTTRNPNALASALRKISCHSEVEALKEHPSMASMCIESPKEAERGLFGRLSGLYATHPPIKERIKRLSHMDMESSF